VLRVLVGENDVQAAFNRAAESGTTISWIVPKAADPGDEAVFLFNRAFFLGQGVVRTAPVPTMHGRRSVSQAEVGALRVFEHPVPLGEIAKHIPDWEWPSYPRSFTTPPPDVAAKLLSLLKPEARSTASSAGEDAGSLEEPLPREDADAPARWKALFPEGYRVDVARALSRSIQAAHALKDTCWTVTLSQEFVRLNVGLPLAMTATPGECNLLVMDDESLLRDLGRTKLQVERQQEFPSAPGTISVAFPLRSLAQVHARMWRSHLQAMTIAATKRPSTIHRGYSIELVEYLRRMGFEVPDSAAPEAVALQAGRVRETASHDAGPGTVSLEAFMPGSIEDGRRYTLASIMRRRGQGEFRDAVLRAYGFACAITGCEVLDVLEAAHIIPYRGEATNHVQNGILLRADLHVLFDVGLLDFDERWRVRLDESLKSTAYAELEGKPLRMPNEDLARPSSEALALRREDRP
jgi:hypothetical protein